MFKGLFGKKVTPKEAIENLIERLNDIRLNINSQHRRIENKIKQYLKNGRTPPGAYLASWKNMEVLKTTIEGSIATLQTALMMSEIGDALKEATKSKELVGVKNALSSITQNLQNVQGSLQELVKLQMRMVDSTQNVTDRLGTMMEDINSMTQDIMSDAAEQLSAEFLAKLQVEDPDFVNSLPKDLLEKLKK